MPPPLIKAMFFTQRYVFILMICQTRFLEILKVKQVLISIIEIIFVSEPLEAGGMLRDLYTHIYIF